jgi:hypothetical protein
VDLVEDDDPQIVQDGARLVDHVAQDLRRHHDQRSLAVDAVVSCEQPDVAGRVGAREVPELLVREGLERRGVEKPLALGAGFFQGILGNHRLA